MDWIQSLAHWFSSAVCDQYAPDTYQVAGVLLPLCARCTGMYLGGLLTLLFHVGLHRRTAGLPRTWVIGVLALFAFTWAGDGVNSLLSTLLSRAWLYPPQNLLRLVTGSLMGITMGTFVFVMFNSVTQAGTGPSAILSSAREWLALLVLSASLVFAVQSEWTLLLYPLAMASLIAILALHTGLMAALVASVKRVNANKAARLQLLGWGLFIALVYLNGIALARLILHEVLGIPA